LQKDKTSRVKKRENNRKGRIRL